MVEKEKKKEKKRKEGKIFSKIKQKWPVFKARVLGTEGIIYVSVIFALAFIVVITVQSCTPRKGDLLYAMCNEFLKLQVPFPDTLQKTEVEFFSSARRIYYTHVDGYGAFQMETLECKFYQDPEKGVQLDRAFFNYIKESTEKTRVPGKGRLYEVKKEVVDLFNASRSPAAIMSAEPDLVIPDMLDPGTKIPPYPEHR